MTISPSSNRDSLSGPREQVCARVREVVREHARLPVAVDTLNDDSDLYEAGLTSHASVNLMLALEDEFEVEFPDAMLLRRTFESIAAIAEALTRISELSR